MNFSFGKLILSLALVFVAGFIGSFFTSSAISTWYAAINKPSFNPPNWLFGPVWTMLYVFMAVSFFLIWQSQSRRKKSALTIFIIHLILNASWSIVFFGLQSPFWALINIAILWLMILLMIIYFWPIKKTASILLWPYLLWVSFASVLNTAIWLLN